MYLTIRGSSIEAIADALADIKYGIEDNNVSGCDYYYGELVSWELNLNQR